MIETKIKLITFKPSLSVGINDKQKKKHLDKGFKTVTKHDVIKIVL